MKNRVSRILHTPSLLDRKLAGVAIAPRRRQCEVDAVLIQKEGRR
jgi:hypothetical protein